MELPMSIITDQCAIADGPSGKREPKSEIDDTRMVLQGASCTIAATLEV
jgi:hypothetical protein